MYLKRLFEPDADPTMPEKRLRLAKLEQAISAIESVGGSADTSTLAERASLRAIVRQPKVAGVQVKKAGPIQKFSPALLDGGKQEGWLSEAKGCATIHGADGDVVYRIVETPGIFCCHCNERLGDSQTAQAHVAREHAETQSPDPCNPAGYRQENGYTGVLLGDAIDTLTPEEGIEMVNGMREALHKKLRPKFGDSRGAAERHRAAKEAAATKEG